MKKLVISVAIVFTFIIFEFAVPAQSSENSDQKQTEQLENLREQWTNMSQEEREKLRSEMRSRAVSRGLSLEVQLQAVKTIEQQAAELKSALESMNEAREQYRNMTEEQRVQYREKIAKMTMARQQAIEAIEQQLEKLRFRGQRRQVPEPQIRINELKEIYQLAVKEKAIETAKRLQEFISSYQNRPSQTQTVIRRPREGQADGTPGRQQQSGSQENQ